MKFLPTFFSFLLLTLTLFTQTAQAIGPNCPPGADVIGSEIGDLCTDPRTLTLQFVTIIVGLAGGISFLVIAIGAIKYVFSTGNPEGIDDAKSSISHGVSGLLLVLLSAFLLRLVGIDILAIPGLTRSPSPGGVITP